MGADMAWQICRCGGIVISNLSAGIDTQAARGALLAGGKCLGILAVPHERVSGRLYEDIAAGGALISEHPPGTVPQKSYFRDRNRIASGLSLGVVVIEAPERSGTRLFAAEAAEQGKEIFAVPGNADSRLCAGSNALIKEGAKLVTEGREVMAEFAPLFPGVIRDAGGECPEVQEPENSREGADTERNSAADTEKDIDTKKNGGSIDLREQLKLLSEDQLRIISAIDKNDAHIDDIIESTGLPASKVLSQLTVLEIKGYVKRKPGRRFSLNTAKK